MEEGRNLMGSYGLENILENSLLYGFLYGKLFSTMFLHAVFKKTFFVRCYSAWSKRLESRIMDSGSLTKTVLKLTVVLYKHSVLINLSQISAFL